MGVVNYMINLIVSMHVKTLIRQNKLSLYCIVIFCQPPPGTFTPAILNLAAILPQSLANGPRDEVV